MRKAILSQADPGLTNALSEICYNCLRGVPKLTQSQKRRLRRHAHDIEFMGDPNVPYKRKRKFLKQKGGFIGTLLTTLLPTVVSLASSALGKLFGSKTPTAPTDSNA